MENIFKVASQIMLAHTTDMVFIKDANLVYVAASMPFVKMVGKTSADEILYRTDLEIFEDRDLAERYVADDQKLIAAGEDLINYIEPITDYDGHARYGTTSKYLLRNGSGEFIGILGVTKDITESYIARLNYQRELRYLFELPGDMYAVTYIDVDSWRIISHRRHMIGTGTIPTYHTVEDLCLVATRAIEDEQCDAARFYRNFTQDVLRRLYIDNFDTLSFEYQRRMSDGALHWVQNDVKFLVDTDSGHLCVMLSAKDIDARKQAEQELVLAASVDRMTMVLNRETTMEQIREILREEAEERHVLFMFDLDNFKALNDTMGHQAGDRMLISFASELQRNFRETDIVGRIGGDEFFALMRKVSDLLEVEKKAEKILNVIRSLPVETGEVKVTGSIGISVFPEHGTTVEELYGKADEALYEAKRNGKNQFVIAKK